MCVHSAGEKQIRQTTPVFERFSTKYQNFSALVQFEAKIMMESVMDDIKCIISPDFVIFVS